MSKKLNQNLNITSFATSFGKKLLTGSLAFGLLFSSIQILPNGEDTENTENTEKKEGTKNNKGFLSTWAIWTKNNIVEPLKENVIDPVHKKYVDTQDAIATVKKVGTIGAYSLAGIAGYSFFARPLIRFFGFMPGRLFTDVADFGLKWGTIGALVFGAIWVYNKIFAQRDVLRAIDKAKKEINHHTTEEVDKARGEINANVDAKTDALHEHVDNVTTNVKKEGQKTREELGEKIDQAVAGKKTVKNLNN